MPWISPPRSRIETPAGSARCFALRGLLLAGSVGLPVASADPPAVEQPASANSEPPSPPTADPPPNTPVPEASEPPRIRWSGSISGGYVYDFSTNFSNGPGSVSVQRAFASVSGRAQFDPALGAGFRIAYEGDFYDFSADSPLSPAPGVKPWSSVQSVQIGGNMLWALSPQVRLTAGLFLEWSGENQANAADSFTIGGTLGATYSFSKAFSIGGGVLVATRLEDSPLFIPLIFIDWRITDSLRITNVAGPEAYPTGAGLELLWEATESFNLSIGGRYEFRQFRLDNSGPADRAGGVGTERVLPIWLRAEWRPDHAWRFDLVGGITTFRRFELQDRFGAEIRSADADVGFFIGGFVGWRF